MTSSMVGNFGMVVPTSAGIRPLTIGPTPG